MRAHELLDLAEYQVLTTPWDTKSQQETGEHLLKSGDLEFVKLVWLPPRFRVGYYQERGLNNYYLFGLESDACVGRFALEDVRQGTSAKLLAPDIRLYTPHLELDPTLQRQGLGIAIYRGFLDTHRNSAFTTVVHTQGASGLWTRVGRALGYLDFWARDLGLVGKGDLGEYEISAQNLGRLSTRFLGPRERFSELVRNSLSSSGSKLKSPT